MVRTASLLAFVVAVGAAGCPNDPPKSFAPPRDYALYLTRYPFGGQTLEWWQERITSLAPGGAHEDAKLYALTVARAQKNGLVVGADGVVKVGPERTARIIARIEEDEAAEKAKTSPAATASTTGAP